MAGLDKVSPDLLKVFCLTAPGNDVLPDMKAVDEWNDQASEHWERFVRLLRDAYPGKEIELWKVWEYQKKSRRALHAHGLIRGLKWIDMETFRACAVGAGFGPHIRLEGCKVSRGGVRGLLGYFSKYLLKAVEDWTLRKHVITSSRGWALAWRRRVVEKRPCSWRWICERDAVVFLKMWSIEKHRPGSRVDVFGPPGGGGDDVEG
jgi:hypothetical protein